MGCMQRSFSVVFLLLAQVWLFAAFTPTWAFQNEAPLKLNQIERLLEIKFEDELLAREINRRGMAFRLDERILERLLKRGLGEQARRALHQQEEAQAYTAYAATTDDVPKRLMLGKAFLQQHPQSNRAAEVSAEVARLELEAFKNSFQLFNATPDNTKLQQLLQSGRLLLSRQSDVAVSLTVTTLLALATATGTLEGFYQDLEPSQILVGQALRLLTGEVVAVDARALQQELSVRALGELKRAQALFLLRQTNSDPEQALSVLSSAIQLAPLTVGREARTFWLQALARELSYQRQLAEFVTISAGAAEKQTGCKRLEEVRAKLVDDYTRVIALSTEPKEKGLHDEAGTALKKLVNSPTPCSLATSTASPPPMPQAHRARKIQNTSPKLRTIFIRSKTVYLRPNQLEAALLKRPDFQTGEWRITRNEKDADLVMEITLPFLSWNWTYEITQRSNLALLATGKVREATAGAAIPRLLDQVMSSLKQIRLIE